MTQILSCATSTLIVQVADRRVTWLWGPNAGGIKDDDRNKVVVVCNRLTIAYSGLAHVAGEPTDAWLLEVVAKPQPYSVTHIIREIQSAADAAFLQIVATPADKRHAFVVAGWARTSTDHSLRPYIWSISNALDDDWKWLPVAGTEFRTRAWRPTDGVEVGLVETGVRLADPVRTSALRQLHACHERAAGPEAFIRTLAEAIWKTAGTHPSVGSNLLAVVLPVAATLGPSGLSGVVRGPLPKDRASSLSLSVFDGNGLFRAPNYTCGGVLYRDIEYGFGVPELGPERPPWYDGPIVLSPRIQSAEGVQPSAVDRYQARGWGLVAEYDRDDFPPPTPCLFKVYRDSPQFEAICNDDEFFVLCHDEAEAGAETSATWKKALLRALAHVGLPPSALGNIEGGLPETRGATVYWLREFFAGRG